MRQKDVKTEQITKDSREEARRQIMIDIVIPIFARYGYDAPSMDQLAAACNCTRRTLYRYWSSKEDLFWAAAARCYSSMGKRLRTISAVWEHAGLSGSARIILWANAYLDQAIEEPSSFRVMISAHEHIILAYGSPDKLPKGLQFAELSESQRSIMMGLAGLDQIIENEGCVLPGKGAQCLRELLGTLTGLIEYFARYHSPGRSFPFGDHADIRRLIEFQVKAFLSLPK